MRTDAWGTLLLFGSVLDYRYIADQEPMTYEI